MLSSPSPSSFLSDGGDALGSSFWSPSSSLSSLNSFEWSSSSSSSFASSPLSAAFLSSGALASGFLAADAPRSNSSSLLLSLLLPDTASGDDMVTT